MERIACFYLKVSQTGLLKPFLSQEYLKIENNAELKLKPENRLKL